MIKLYTGIINSWIYGSQCTNIFIITSRQIAIALQTTKHLESVECFTAAARLSCRKIKLLQHTGATGSPLRSVSVSVPSSLLGNSKPDRRKNQLRWCRCGMNWIAKYFLTRTDNIGKRAPMSDLVFHHRRGEERRGEERRGEGCWEHSSRVVAVMRADKLIHCANSDQLIVQQEEVRWVDVPLPLSLQLRLGLVRDNIGPCYSQVRAPNDH